MSSKSIKVTNRLRRVSDMTGDRKRNFKNSLHPKLSEVVLMALHEPR